jgi:hypothetical protein
MRKSSARSHKPASIKFLAELLEQIDPNLGHGDWIRVLMAVSHETGGSEEGFHLVDNWSSGGQTYPGSRDLYKQWQYIDPNHEPPVTVGTLIWMARNSR